MLGFVAENVLGGLVRIAPWNVAETNKNAVLLASQNYATYPHVVPCESLVAVRNGRKSSAIKSAAARENGRKGGRPKLALAL